MGFSGKIIEGFVSTDLLVMLDIGLFDGIILDNKINLYRKDGSEKMPIKMSLKVFTKHIIVVDLNNGKI